MDFIEKLFGFSPDGGDGSTEFTIILVLAAVAVLIASQVFRRRRGAP